MRIYKRLLSWTAALAITTQLLSPVAFAVGQQARSTDTQTSSAQETVYVNSYGGEARQVDFNNHWRFNLGDGSAATDYNEADYKAYNDLKARYDHQMHEWEKASYELEITEEQYNG